VRRELDKEFPYIQLLSARASAPLKNFSQYHSYSYSANLVNDVDVCLDTQVQVLVEVNLGAYFLLNNKMPPSSS